MGFASIILEVNDPLVRGKKGMSSLLQTMPFLDRSFSYESEVKKEIGIELVWKDNSELPSCVKGKVVGKVVVPRYQRYMVQNAVAQTVPIPKP